jgi:hypothetical protein
MLLSVVSVLVVAQSISEIPDELMNNHVLSKLLNQANFDLKLSNHSSDVDGGRGGG